MRIDLIVPFADNAKVKRLGARWDLARKVWYIVDPESVEPFWSWIPEYLKKPHQESPQRARSDAKPGRSPT